MPLLPGHCVRPVHPRHTELHCTCNTFRTSNSNLSNPRSAPSNVDAVASDAYGPHTPTSLLSNHQPPQTLQSQSQTITLPRTPPLSSLHVTLLSEPPRAFMGRGMPPDRRRLSEWGRCGCVHTQLRTMGLRQELTPTSMSLPRDVSASRGDHVPVSLDVTVTCRITAWETPAHATPRTAPRRAPPPVSTSTTQTQRARAPPNAWGVDELFICDA